ncbi:hypothetical protein GRF29_19g2392484 [Pseudopithomyces chartarum]|uniref:Cytochrome P450 monooxygenase n=1 Tax=Pseudopithomyces chartarum TaxID=1892770 RepID=A0AAN6M6S7_9PLEO|nr:hypothetical protein GRF29_19g2392484 [Pseudopithomyces chartarum]
MDVELLGIGHSAQTVAIATVFFLGFFLFTKVNFNAQLRKLPAIGAGKGETYRKRFLEQGKAMYEDGYKKFKDSAFRITAYGEEQVIIGPRFLPELRKLPDSVLSFPKAVELALETKYTKVETEEPLLTHSIKADLTPALARLNPIIFDEVERAFHDEMPDCKDWTAVNVWSKIAAMVAKISGRLFVGPELCHDEKYLEMAVNYALQLNTAQEDIKKLRPIFKPWTAPRLESVKKLHEARKQLEEFLAPIIQSRRDAKDHDPNWIEPDDMLSWLMKRQEEIGDTSTKRAAAMQLGLNFAAILTTTLTTTNILYTLAVSPDDVAMLREEVQKTLVEHGGTLTSRALQQMLKLDSYMKECMRFYPPGYTTFTRRVLKSFTLSNGQTIPAGVIIETPSHAVYQDPELYPGPNSSDTFDSLRSYKLRQAGGATEHARNQFVTTNEQNLMFGYGRHACPGRFFAANEIKMILSRFLLNYEFKNEDGSDERYAQIELGKVSAPNAEKSLLFRRI